MISKPDMPADMPIDPARPGQYAPLALFVYRRRDAACRVLEALERCYGFAETPVTIFSDAARTQDVAREVADVRAAIRSRLRPNVRLVEQRQNQGLANSVIAGVSALVASHRRAIVLEDDLLPAPTMLQWFNAALDRFADEQRVMQVGAHMFDVPAIRQEGRGVFFRHPTSKGWAVWQRSWAKFDPDCKGWENRLADPAYRARFGVHGAMRFENMMRMQMAGKLSSWAIRFHDCVIAHDGLTLFPPMSLVEDIGMEAGRATHGQRSARLLPPSPLWQGTMPPLLPEKVEPDDWAIAAWARRLKWSAYGAAMGLAALRDGMQKMLAPKP